MLIFNKKHLQLQQIKNQNLYVFFFLSLAIDDNFLFKKTTTTKGNILLHSIENKLISQRKAAKNETKVEHCSSHGCSQCTPTIINSTSNVQEFISEESCCAPPTTVSCTCTSCVRKAKTF